MARRLLYICGIHGSTYREGDGPLAAQTLAPLRAELVHCHLDDLELLLDGDAARLTARGEDVTAFDQVVFRGPVARYFRLAYPAALMLEHFGTPFFNTGILDYAGIDKVAQAVRMWRMGLPIPATAFSPRPERLAPLVTRMGLPCVVKGSIASQGERNHLVRHLDQLPALQATDDADHSLLLVQRFIPNDGDYRLLCVGEQRLLIHRTAPAGSHLNNTSAGGTGTVVPLDTLSPEVWEQASALQRAFRMELCGIDVIVDRDTGAHAFLEINSQPALFGGAAVEQKLALFRRHLEG